MHSDILVSRNTADGRDHRGTFAVMTAGGRPHQIRTGLVTKLVESLTQQGLLKHALSLPSEAKALDAKCAGRRRSARRADRIQVDGFVLAARWQDASNRYVFYRNAPFRAITLSDILGVPYDELGAALIYFTVRLHVPPHACLIDTFTRAMTSYAPAMLSDGHRQRPAV